ncbi:MAG: hypothetical protein JO154_18005 [Chitinophaga sp.]|uniref:hypothetical protein n=1 Tax=Chitinophaga sp. TaxID=1869181 RepID=UPI0025BBD8AE|nr:hypothetical protein [Chitinophaga sp.]MBV8254500.1 hypothetical protein [Chitinophaga sp.]
MRSFVALMACIACIAWVHSCEKRLLSIHIGIQPQSLSNLTVDAGTADQLPVVAADDHAITAQEPFQTQPKKLAANLKLNTKPTFIKKAVNISTADSSFFNAMVIKQLSHNGAILTP